MENPGITSKPSMVKLGKNHAPNSANFGRTCSKEERKKLVGGYFDRLPCDILHNIALMLPFDSIIQLRRSSKFWYNCVRDPKFVDLQLTYALQKSRGCLFTAAEKNCMNDELYTLEQSGSHLTTSKISNYSTETYGIRDFQSSGGLICVFSSKSKSFRIFNPYIGQEVEVLDVPKFKECRHFGWWFFSYSPSTKEYKILKIGVLRLEDETNRNRGCRTIKLLAAITTLGSNIWWEIQNVPPDLSSLHFAECQGILFWITRLGLTLFDIVSEKFHEIPDPPSNPVHVIGNSRERLIVNDKLISMGHTVGYLKDCRLWVLEDKTKGIWTNKYDFSSPPLQIYARGLKCISRSGGLFGSIENSTSVFRQNMKRRRFKAIEIKLDKYIGEKDPTSIYFSAPHVRSLVSPVRVMEIGSTKLPTGSGQQIYDHSDLMDISLKRKWVLETLKLDYDASENDLFNNMYKFMREYDDQPRLKRLSLIAPE
ncbi:putative F-box protein At1g47790 [Silene latifolia]|uniref:putative F-box protein At1g47790 n=1 Tax=Silene latifolia TaxID=37657 RepID=UPI003D78574E